MTSRLPQRLWRKKDGARFSLNADGGTYSMDSSRMARPYRYTLEKLASTRAFSVTPTPESP